MDINPKHASKYVHTEMDEGTYIISPMIPLPPPTTLLHIIASTSVLLFSHRADSVISAAITETSNLQKNVIHVKTLKWNRALQPFIL